MFGKRRQAGNPTLIKNPLLFALRGSDPNGTLTVNIDTAQLRSAPEAGLIMADIAKHMANALAQSGKADSSQTALGDIRALFDAELDSPTQDAEGGMTQ
jgi:hypothetical protein